MPLPSPAAAERSPLLLNAISLLCALLIGFASHRASLCNVRAVAEILTAGTAHMLWSFLQTILWMATLTGGLVLLLATAPQMALARIPLAWRWPGAPIVWVRHAAGGVLLGAGGSHDPWQQ